MIPYVQDADFTLYVGDVRRVLAELPAESVDCCVTSPPYWGLRDYGTDGQIGLEASPEEFVAEMVAVFREVRRVLAPHGTLWLNLGDSYAGSWGAQGHTGQMADRAVVSARQIENHPQFQTRTGSRGLGNGLKPKDLVGIPWRVAFALQADGWYLRADIIWSKPNPMPESVTDRPTKAHEYVFLLSKQPRYFFDQEAVREPAAWERWGDQTNAKHEGSGSAASWISSRPKAELTGGRQARHYDAEHFKTTDERNTRYQGPNPVDGRRNVRNVWEMEQAGRPNGARHTLNDGYFEAIDCEEKAYWLGFLYADGCYLGRRHVDLQLAERDHNHVLEFRTAVGSSANVNPPRNGRSRVVISSRRMADSLRAIGLDTKNRIPDMPTECVRHFVRGLFDGDGSIWSYLPAGRPRVRYAASMLGTERILLEVRDLLGLRGKPKLDRGIHKISIAAADDIARLHDYLYRDATVFLARKRAEFPQEQHVAPDVWSIATQPYPDAHFATFPEALPERCIKAGCPEFVCVTCGEPRVRELERKFYGSLINHEKRLTSGATRNDFGGQKKNAEYVAPKTVGWSDCGHGNYRPGVVLDPFIGSGTTALVARRHGRHTIGIELNPEYAERAARRLSQLSLLAEETAG